MSSPLKILVFSHRPEVRETIITAVGRRPAAGFAPGSPLPVDRESGRTRPSST